MRRFYLMCKQAIGNVSLNSLWQVVNTRLYILNATCHQRPVTSMKHACSASWSASCRKHKFKVTFPFRQSYSEVCFASDMVYL